MNREQRMEEALAYFKSRHVYKKLFAKIKDKYASLGRMGGSFQLTGLDARDKADLGGFFRKDYTENKTVTISMAALEKALAESRFSELGWEEILKAYFAENLVIRKEEEERQQKEKEAFFRRIQEERNPQEIGCIWLEKSLREKSEGYLFLIQRYKENASGLRKLLDTVFEACTLLTELKRRDGQEEKELLAVFAARATGNPHFFDEGTDGEKLLQMILKDHLQIEEEAFLSRVEKKNRILFEAGLLKDDLSNDTLVYGIRAWDREGKLHEGIEGFRRCREPMKLTLWSVGRLGCVKPVGASKVYVVENPAVFSILIRKYPDRTLICSNGQPRLATLLLMDLLNESGSFCYAGDYDPEGLLIAQRLKDRYKENFAFWNYDPEGYKTAMSEVVLEESRLNKLQHVTDEALQPIKTALLRYKKAAYQENMLENYQIE